MAQKKPSKAPIQLTPILTTALATAILDKLDYHHILISLANLLRQAAIYFAK